MNVTRRPIPCPAASPTALAAYNNGLFRRCSDAHGVSFAAAVQVKQVLDPERGFHQPYLPMGRFIHVPPADPVSNWKNDFGLPWWRVSGHNSRVMRFRTIDHRSVCVCAVNDAPV